MEARLALEARGIELVATGPVSDDPERVDEQRAIEELSREDFDLLVVCVAGWIPSHTVIDVISHFAHKPRVLWGLTGHMESGRLVTTANQAGTTALRDPLKGLEFNFKVIEIPEFQRLLRHICENGSEHHVAMNRSQVAAALNEALGKYMGWDVFYHPPTG